MKRDLDRLLQFWWVVPGLCLFTAPVLGGIVAIPEFPVEGGSATITVSTEEGTPAAGLAVQAVYRPGSAVERLEDIGSTGVDGSVTWSPTGAGIVLLQTVAVEDGPSYTLNLSVRYDGLPKSGLAILLFAGIFLYGGIIWGFRSLRALPPQLPPDT